MEKVLRVKFLMAWITPIPKYLTSLFMLFIPIFVAFDALERRVTWETQKTILVSFRNFRREFLRLGNQ